jgi:FAD/FMN-containing dehydrogenase
MMATRLRTNDVFHGIPDDALITDADECAFYAQDVFTKGPQPLAVLRPGSIDELSRGVGQATSAGIAVIPRGGGMSYTSGYVAPDAGALIVDLGRMNRILGINETDMTVTVEAGVSWHQLYEALHPIGLRTPLWGTLSGIRASVGGGMSQNGTFWGGGRGTIAPNSICYVVVLADGSMMRTGIDFFRPFGPDVTGLFGSDAGAFGIKAHIILPLIREAEAFAYGSFAFDTPAQYCGAMSEIGRQGLASEAFGFDPFLTNQRMKRDSLTSDAKQLVGMMKAQGSFWKAIKEGAKVVAAGRSFLDDAGFSIHLICEARMQAAADEDMRRVEAIVAANGGRIVENTIPKILRANPFPPTNSMAGPEGERWAPVHGIVKHSKATETITAITGLFETHAEEMDRLGVGAGYMFLLVANTGFLIEPCFYWPDEQWELHRRSIEPAHFGKLKVHPHNPESYALVQKLRLGVIEVFGRLGGVHMQIGRTYPVKERSDPRAWAILEAVKREVDPKGLMNPGALGL